MHWVLVILLVGDQWALPLDLHYPSVMQCELNAEEWRSFPWTVAVVCLPALLIEDDAAKPPKRTGRKRK